MTKERVLIVDDEKNIVSSLEGILSDEGYEVSTADDGIDALELIQTDPPDLVLLDIWLPGIDGIEVLKTVKTYYPEIEVLIMSGHGTIDTAVKATKLGASNFIEKPFSLDQLTQSIEQALSVKKRAFKVSDRESARHKEVPFCFDMMVEIKKAIKDAVRHNKPVLIHGEPGTGKELIAQAIHRLGKKSNRPFLKLNCAVRPMPSIQAQLFQNTRKGIRSTGTVTAGQAEEKVIYLSNIDSLSKGLQEKLALALKNHNSKKMENGWEFLPVRFMASSSSDLKSKVKKGQFHKGLYDILEGTSISIPPLREYREHIPVLIQTYYEEFVDEGETAAPEFDKEAMDALMEYSWPGNIKQLRSCLDQVLIAGSARGKIGWHDLPTEIREAAQPARSNGSTNGHGKQGSTAAQVPYQIPQRTLKRSVVLCGSGLHSGIKTGLILQPLPPGSGIIFGDISSGKTIPAKLENVQSTDYSTCLGKGPSSVATIEHIMAVLHMYRITNLLIKIGDEAPVMDGSAKDFCHLLEDGEFEDQGDPIEEVVIDKRYTFGSEDNGKAFISIEPADTFTVTYHMDYPAPIGVQDFTYTFEGSESFKKEIAPARTFGFLEDVAQLNAMGFGTGGKLDNFILLGDNKVLNTELRYENEFVRHKILDIIGDFYLLGKPIRGLIKAHKSGHTQNVGLLNQIKASLSS